MQEKLSVKQNCAKCHREHSPMIVSDWELSKHSKNEVSCVVCHGATHVSGDDVAKVKPVKPDRCGMCHQVRWDQFRSGKHAQAWKAMKAMPTVHWQPMALVEGMKGCGGCHKLGLKTDKEIQELKEEGSGFGLASCDACHTRHAFSITEAQQPQACQTCHMGFDHPQWEMYSSSKHGVRYLLKQTGVLPESTAAPTCQTCHMEKGNHEVRTAWGFMAIRQPMPEDKHWAAARKTIMKALGQLDPDGNRTARFHSAKAVDLMRLTQQDWQKERDKMIKTCNQCHSINFAKRELQKGDEMIRETDLLLAEAIQIVADLYKDHFLQKPESYAYPFPDLLTINDAPTVIEQRLFEMFKGYRMRTFQGTFHASPDYAFWYGWSEMRKGFTEIKWLAELLQKKL